MANNLIDTAERKWLGRAYAYCRACFSGLYLPSHDERHHLRVWRFAGELLPLAARQETPLGGEEVEALLLASLLHDTGMAHTLSHRHGAEGRRLAAAFFDTIDQPVPLREAILRTIELHDDKEYREHPDTATPAGRLLLLLSVADDLDAFGHYGIFRYFEIYTLRGMSPEGMARQVVGNLERRFAHMEPLLAADPALLDHHRQRYLTTHRFFAALAEGKEDLTAGILEYLTSVLAQRKKIPDESDRMLPARTEDPHLRAFLEGLFREAVPPAPNDPS